MQSQQVVRPKLKRKPKRANTQLLNVQELSSAQVVDDMGSSWIWWHPPNETPQSSTDARNPRNSSGFHDMNPKVKPTHVSSWEGDPNLDSSWWFRVQFLYGNPKNWGRWTHFDYDNIFSKGLVQPPPIVFFFRSARLNFSMEGSVFVGTMEFCPSWDPGKWNFEVEST